TNSPVGNANSTASTGNSTTAEGSNLGTENCAGSGFPCSGIAALHPTGKKYHIVWLILIWSLIQDGIGGLPFGYSVLWYSSILVLYRCGAMFFDVQSMMFALLCGVVLGALHPALTAMMSMLADMV
ncbi:hypothetical protein ADUPG1_001599, partial [Aduncisulcus paluster]